MNGSTYVKNIFLWWIACCYLVTMLHAVKGPKDYQNNYSKGSGEVINSKLQSDVNPEPSCEELKAMWRFSKRQSRAAEITNEIPTYRDPFTYNIWNPYYTKPIHTEG